jgi:hypothetical protein
MLKICFSSWQDNYTEFGSHFYGAFSVRFLDPCERAKAEKGFCWLLDFSKQ